MLPPALLEENRPATDALDAAAMDQSPGQLILLGAIALAIGGALFLPVARGVALRWPSPEPSRRVGWAAVLWIGLLIALYAATRLAGLFGLLPEPAEEPSASTMKAALAFNVALFLGLSLAAFASVRVAGGTQQDVGLQDATPIASLLAAVATYLALIPLFVGTALIDSVLRGAKPQKAVQVLASDAGLRSDPAFLLMVAVAIPVLEEFLFRGILQPFLQRLVSFRVALVTQAALFALVHDAGMLPIFVLALGLGWLAHRTQSLLAPMAVHILHNACIIQLLRLGPGVST